jgi:hypothetical protein
MGGKLLWTGLTLIVALDFVLPGIQLAGKIIMIIGLILMWLNK